jgi:hypothetical protein
MMVPTESDEPSSAVLAGVGDVGELFGEEVGELFGEEVGGLFGEEVGAIAE